MKCPFCATLDSKVVDSRPANDGTSIRRRRECLKCHNRFTTYETVEVLPIIVIKKNGMRQAFDRNKLLTSMLKACEKRSVSLSLLEKAADEIEKELQNELGGEISSTQIGELVMEKLKDLDEVAYVRFASVYRQFKDINTFMDELTKLLDRRPKELSGGQQQRVAIGRAVIRRPKLFLMDEPFSNLDPALRVQMRQVIRQLHETLGTTFLYVTHDQREALALGTRIAVMKDGMLRQFGTPAQIFNTPEDRFVAEFVGEPPMNFLEKLPVQSENGRSFVHILGQHYAVNCPPGQTVDAGFRPVHLVLSANGFPAQVTQALQADGELHLSLDADGTPLRAVLPSDTPLPLRGQVLHFQLSPKYLHFFDPGTGKRLP